ncbi:MAG: thioredoxin [Clostridiales bacterium]|jgi:thioredoxin 1|nr:thioredoxin [Clostridiales bacterium]
MQQNDSANNDNANAVKITNENFNELINGEQPVLVDFHAAWCGPCQRIAPMVEQIVDELHGVALVAKADVDECPEIAREFNVASVPTFIVFKNGEEVEREVGVRPRDTLIGLVQQHI